MALFGTKKNTEKKAAPKAKSTAVKAVKTEGATTTTFAHLILRPRVTEKAATQNEKYNVYTFEVASKATKKTVAHAVKELYKVSPAKVNVINLPAKAVFVRGKNGMQSAVKKALVYLKKGDKIE